MKIKLKDKFSSLTNGVWVGYTDKGSDVRVVQLFPGLVVEVDDEEGKRVLEVNPAVEEVENKPHIEVPSHEQANDTIPVVKKPRKPRKPRKKKG